MVAKIEDWDRYPNGKLVMHAIIGMGVMPVTSGHQVLRIEFATNPMEMAQIASGEAQPHVAQLGLTVEQARKLAEMLTHSVTQFEAVSSTGGKAN